ncbi:MAG TPA: 50S ribosomal protein L25/general stress protein Ctc [Burkholderiales bacterium]|nr:50S ribosomal protein L25/general stress protein Ctc [Burkholderiales bacterium]
MEIGAAKRTAQGTGASRRLRHAGRVPGILYGGKDAPVNIELDHSELFQAARKEAFHASVITLKLDGQAQPVLLRAMNMHPWKLEVQHVDFQRVLADRKIHMRVPLHFVKQENSPAVKVAGAVVNHVMNDIDISCLPADLPEFILVDLSNLTIGHSVHVKDLQYPKGVEPVLHRGENPVVASASMPRAAEVEEAAVVEEVVPASMVPAAKQQPEKPEAAAAPEKGERGEKPAKEEKEKKK